MERTAEKIQAWIARQVSEAGARGVVVGLSGGVDSAATAVLSLRALGVERVLGVIMPCHSDPQDEADALLLCETFGIRYERVDLATVFDAACAVLPKEASDVVVANIKPRLRMMTLYYHASMHNYIVAGTGNKSELMVGYFTKYGDGGVDILPIGGLWKTQVWKLAEFLGVPERIVKKAPSAGLWAGQTDEGEMGISYEVLDKVLDAFERGGTPEGVPPETVDRVRRMVESSEHKRKGPIVCEI